MQCPHCGGAGRYVPVAFKYRSLACPRCAESGEVSEQSEQRRQRLCAMLRENTVPSVAQQIGRAEHEVVSWSIGQREIPEGVL